MTLRTIALFTSLSLCACAHGDGSDEDLVPEPRVAAPEDAAAKATSTVESIYLLEQLGPDQYAVDLSGGKSELQSAASFLGTAEPAKKSIVRTVSGRVLDEQGKPVAGAVVVAGTRLSAMLGPSLSAQHGATTESDGSFALPLVTGDDVVLLALANETAWSSLQEIEAGTDDVEIDVGLAAPAQLEGHMKRNGKSVTPVATIMDRDEQPRLLVRVVGEADGSYESPPLPPGSYEVAYSVDRGRMMSGRTVEQRAVTLAPGKVGTADVAFFGGTELTLAYEGLEDERLQTVTYTVLAGRHAPASRDALADLRKADGTEVLAQILVGGIDLRPSRSFNDIPAGEVTACLEALGTDEPGQWGRGEREMAFQCRTIELSGDAQTLTFDL